MLRPGPPCRSPRLATRDSLVVDADGSLYPLIRALRLTSQEVRFTRRPAMASDPEG